MREHMGLFRGKRKDNGEWIEGFYCEIANSQSGLQEHFILTIKSDGRADASHKVDPDTVGECTGLRDKAGKMIFEGDILEVIRNKARWICFVEDVRNLPTTMFGSAVESIEIIGTTTDNPELLEGGES